MSKIMIMGDIHGYWGPVNTLINKKKPDIILQCGDFGFWPHYHNRKDFDGSRKPWDQWGLKMGDTKLYWCDGNHENHDRLDEIYESNGKAKRPLEIMKNVYWCPRGTVLELPSGEKVLFIGGADSTDKEYRKENLTWWRQELITQKDIYELPETNIDIVISHTTPRCILEYLSNNHRLRHFGTDSSELALDVVLKKYKPKYWYSGHLHRFIPGQYGKTKFNILSAVNFHDKYWMWME